MEDFRLRHTHNDYTIGWVCALPNEQTAAILMLDDRHEDLPNPTGDHNTYMLGSIGKHNVVIAGLPLGRVGNNTAATVATRMVSSFPNIRVGLMVGVGGGIPHKTRLGDVVISCPNGTEPGVVQWDMGKTEAALTRFKADHITTRKNMLKYLKKLEKDPDVPESYKKSDSLQDLLFHPSYGHVEADESCLSDEDEDDCRRCDKSKLVRRSKRESGLIHCGLIASGNQVIKDANLRDSLSKQFKNEILCIEMEAAGLMNDFPCVVIRGIADYSDSHKNEKWQDYAAATAAACAKALLMVVATSEVDKLQRVQLTISPTLIQSAMHYWPFWKNEKKDTADPRVVTAFEDSNLETDPRRPPLEMAQLDDTSRNAKSGETTPEEEKPPKMVAIEAPKRASSYDTSPTHQTLESWLQGAPPFLAAKFRQGSIDDAMRDIRMGLGQSPVPREDENRTEMLSPERTYSMPSQASMPFPEESKGITSERNDKPGNIRRHSNPVPSAKTPSDCSPELRVRGHEQSQTNNDDNARSKPQSPSRSIKYRFGTPSPVRREQERLVSEQNHGQFNNAPASSGLYISTKRPNSGYDANGRAIEYPLSPPQSPQSTNLSSYMRRDSGSLNDDEEIPSGYDSFSENNDILRENLPFVEEPDQINSNEGQGGAPLSQSLQRSSIAAEKTPAHGSRTGSNDIAPRYRSTYSRHPGASVASPGELRRSATPIPSPPPPYLDRKNSTSRQPIRNSHRGPGYSRPPGPNTPNPSDRQRSATPTPSQSRRPPLMTMDNNSVPALGTKTSQTRSQIKSKTPNKVQSNATPSRLPRLRPAA
ncbi:phosphorylase superfamily domain-containing protein [Trichoderma breve]|uniref:Phosphorylase superfamily domain-containing protein n=1 Tax=Trichoderma breve TaxID=2034170 RepID=A0A9W9BC09_9HYPO|nr:phosphorylase superfamily domain-containing protein [Trichoderma breve]KAJ4857550.1 phosphorylase superfamily domain-containing protein [Trichoderma breve]